jgi:hypothetical protein
MSNDLRLEIENAINRVCAENVSNTPDFILAEFMIDCLAAFDKATNTRSAWYSQNSEFAKSTDSANSLQSEKMPYSECLTKIGQLVDLDKLSGGEGGI